MIVVREVSDALAAYGCDVARARAQHKAYVEAIGLTTTTIAPDPLLADCCFVEDTAVIHPRERRALITHMGRADRRPETAATKDALEQLGYDLTIMVPPATLDGGDVLRTHKQVFVGLSKRTNEWGVRGLERFLGEPCTKVPVDKCLHLKSAVTQHHDGTLLLDPDLIDPNNFGGYRILETNKPNCLNLKNRTLVGDPDLPGTYVDTSEFAKADGSLTCLSLLLFV